MGLNLDVDGYTKTLNNWKILWNMQKKLLKTKSILKLMYKLSGGPSFTFTVACSGDNSSLRQQQIDPNIVRISNDNCKCWGASLRAKVIGQIKLPMAIHQWRCVSMPALTQAVEKNFGDTFLWQEVFWCAIKKYIFHCYILLEFNWFQLNFVCVHTSGVKLLELSFTATTFSTIWMKSCSLMVEDVFCKTAHPNTKSPQ